VSTYVTDPNMHEATAYEAGEELVVAVSRDTLVAGRLRLDVIRLGGPEEALLPGVVLERQESIDLAHHILNVHRIGNPNMGLLWRRIGDLLGAPGDEMRALGKELQGILEGSKR
jgi:hypothetical protein